MPATLFHKITESFAGTLFIGHSEGELLYLEQVALRSTTSAPLIDAIVRALSDMRQLSGKTISAPSHVVRFMGQIGIVAPYFEAVPLRLLQVTAREKKVPFPVGVAIKIALDVFDGLCLYHALETKLCGGICPDQLLVGTDGDTRVGNVPVPAISPKESPWRGRVERLMYLAPEQITAKVFDARTDVYAMGVIVWEMITNQPRLVGTPGHMLEWLRGAHGPPVLAPLDAAGVSKGLIDALSRALHPDPAMRQPSIGAFARELLEADETPAQAKDVGAFVEQVASETLQELRTAVTLQQIQAIRRSRTAKDDAPATRSEPNAAGNRPPATPTDALAASLPPNSDHTAVFKVSAELLQRARRGPVPSDSRPPVAPPSALELPVESDQTVTFEVPENLLEEARRLFEASERDAHDAEPKSRPTPTGADLKGQTPPPAKSAVPLRAVVVAKAAASAPAPSTGSMSEPLAKKEPASAPAAKAPAFALKKGPMSVPRPTKNPVPAPTPSRGLASAPSQGPAMVPAPLKGPLVAPPNATLSTPNVAMGSALDTSPPSSKGPASPPASAAVTTSPPAPPPAQEKSTERTLDQMRAEELLKKLRGDGSISARVVKPPDPKLDDDVTTLWRPQRDSENLPIASEQSGSHATPPIEAPEAVVSVRKPAPLAPQQTATSRRLAPRDTASNRRKPAPNNLAYWLMGLVISVVVGALTILVSRILGR